jgi:hypothetical protein
MKIRATIFLTATLVGCATAPSKYDSSDLNKAEYTVALPLQAVYAKLQDRARYCGGLIHGYVPEWYPSQDMKSAKIDLYTKTGLGSRSSYVAALIALNTVGTATHITVNVPDATDHGILRWSGWWRPKVANIVSQFSTDSQPTCQ